MQQPAQIIELPELHAQSGNGAAILNGNLGLFQSVKVRLSVVVGHAHTTLGELMALRDGAVMKLDRHIDLPVDVLVEGNVVARGHLVVVDDNFGLRVSEVAPQQQAA